MTFILLLLSFSIHAQEQYGSLNHPNCKVHIANDYRDKEKRFLKKAKSILDDRGYDVVEVSRTEKIGPGQLTFEYLRVLEDKGIYPPCQVETILSKTTGDVFKGPKRQIYQKKARRMHPRVTKEGFSRCSMAVRDSMAELPKCQKI